MMADKFDPMGADKVKELYPQDHTHFNAVGADLHAAAVVAGLNGLRPGPVGKFLSANVEIKPTNPLRFSLDYTKSRLTRTDTQRLAYDDNIFSFRSSYQFTRFVFVRSRIDYTTLGSRVRGQFLFGWTPNPGTSFYAGYNDDMNYRGFSPFTDRYEPGFQRNGRTFFLKMSYLIRKNIM